MTKYEAVINTPGYLPMADEPAVFDTAQEAWDYLAEERGNAEDDFPYADDDPRGEDYTDTYRKLAALGTEAHWQGRHKDVAPWLVENGLTPDGTGSVYGDTPGYDGSHDLGIAYSVVLWEDGS